MRIHHLLSILSCSSCIVACGAAPTSNDSSSSRPASEADPADAPSGADSGVSADADVDAANDVALEGYFVAPGGNDGNPGTIDRPFATVQHCASIAKAGDRCILRAGVYRETVRPARSGTKDAPIRFESYPGEKATLSGADPISGWTVESGSIYAAPMSWTLGEGYDQLFVDGVMVNEARWPNTTSDVSHPTLARITGGTRTAMTGTLTDPALTMPTDFWKGAYLTKGNSTETGTVNGVHTESAKVVSSSPGSLDVQYLGLPFGTTPPEKGNPYFLFGKREALDAAGEWFVDAAAKKVSLWTPDGSDPSHHLVEARSTRKFAFDLSGRSFVELHDLSIFAASISTDSSTTDCSFDTLDVRYVSHFLVMTDDATPRETHVMDTGIVLDGTRNVLRNSEIAFSAGNGVLLQGTSNVVTHDTIHDVDYMATECAAVSTGIQTYPTPSLFTVGHEISFNALYNSGRGLIVHRELRGGKITNNLVHDACLQRDDCGAIYTRWLDGSPTGSSDESTWTEIAFNVVHDVKPGALASAALYFDDFSHHYVAHHNVIWNAQLGVHEGEPSDVKVYSTTFANIGIADVRMRMASKGGTNNELRDLIVDANAVQFTPPGDVVPPGFLVMDHVLDQTKADPKFVDAPHFDFSLNPGSPAIDVGVALPPYTDGFVGSAPDLGAFERGAPVFVVGP